MDSDFTTIWSGYRHRGAHQPLRKRFGGRSILAYLFRIQRVCRLHSHYVIGSSRLIIVIGLLPVCVQSAFLARTDFLFDFGVFYCAGRVVTQGAEAPYLAEPLRSCEHAVIPGFLSNKNENLANLVAPAPLPGYAIAGVRPTFASTVRRRGGTVVGATLSCLGCMHHRTGSIRRRRVANGACGAFASLGATSIPLGQVVPVAIAASALQHILLGGDIGAPRAFLRQRSDRTASRASGLRRAGGLGACNSYHAGRLSRVPCCRIASSDGSNNQSRVL